MIVTPFARLPRKKYDPRLENVPRIDVQYLEDYVSDSDTESAVSEESFKFSDESDEESESSSFWSPEDNEQQSAQWSDSGEDESQNQENEIDKQEEESRMSALSNRSRARKVSVAKRIKNYIRRRPAYVKFQLWRKKNAEARRHAMIRRYERMAVEIKDHLREEILAKMDEDEKVVRKTAKRLGRIQKTLAIRQEAKYKKNAKFEQDKARRKAEQKRLEFNVFHLKMWAFENSEREKVNAQREVARREHEEMVKKDREMVESRKAYENTDDNMLREDIDETQKVLRIGRASGALRGVNARAHQVVPMPVRETDRKLFLRIRDDVDFSWKPKHMRSKESLMPFTEDLRLFADVETLVGVNIGERGCLALSAEFLRGSCSNVIVLDLSRCLIRSRGLGRLLHGLRIGRVVNLHTLILRGNALCPTALEFLRTGLTNGSLSNLRTLDMRENELGDDGADKIAHMMVVEVFSTISVLKLQRNRISDTGIKKIVDVLRAVIDVKCPLLTQVRLEENMATKFTKLKLRPLPRGVSV